MAYDDRSIIETKEKKNEFESYIYDMRDKLSSQGILHNYIEPAKIQPFLQELAKGEEWLYGEGQNQVKDVYEAKITALKKVGEPVKTRYFIYQNIPAYLSQIQTTIQTSTTFIETLVMIK
jgi:molecular chaperone DnaK (HSP70)